MPTIWPPELQGTNQNLCWACTLSWWSRFAPGREYKSVKELLEIYSSEIQWDDGGAALPSALSRIWGGTRWRTKIMTDERLSMTKLYKYTVHHMSETPLMVAYYDKELGGLHANAVWAENGSYQVHAMDPNDGYVTREVEHYRSERVTNLIAIVEEAA